jgi:spermidine synthase
MRVAIMGGEFIAKVKARSDVLVWEVTQANRDELPRRLAREEFGRLSRRTLTPVGIETTNARCPAELDAT